MDTAIPPVAGIDTARLAEAFHVFNQASEELASAYARLEGQVAALTERMALLQEALPAGVVVLNASGNVAEANAAAAILLGRSPVGAPWAEVEGRFSPTDTPGEHRLLDHRLAVTVTPLDSAGGRIVLLHDVTETHRLRVQAERNERLAAMGEMAAQLAHQLRTPLAAALLYAGNLELPGLSDASRIPVAEKIVARLKHLERLIQDTLLFARGEVLGRETFPVIELLNELAVTFEPLARSRNVEFQIDDRSEGASLTGNRKALAGALTNLVENAMQAVDAGGSVVLGSSCLDGQLSVTVRDNGRGMSEAVVARLFEPFFTTRHEGTGLGLAIARGVARAHGGSIDVRSEPGAGTEFVITLPLGASL
ncbi:MAG TPA: HAMP domain-containing sensor histidine kinase [Rhodocyclaceae bacterium]|nr:HAMP domain-containing sensor histidine kinase [Rhodocyclaceae bacterium]